MRQTQQPEHPPWPAALDDAPDFAEKSKYVPQKEKEQRWLDVMLDNYSGTASPWEDPLYEYINGNEEAGAWLSEAGANSFGPDNVIGAIFGRATENKSESQEMTEQEVARFNYLYATQGSGAAHAYYDYLQADLNYRQRKKDVKYWENYAAQDPVGSSVFSVVMSPMKGLSYIGQMADYIGDGEIDQNAQYNKFSYMISAIRETVPKNWGAVGTFAYQTGMSMADFLLTTTITGGNQAAALSVMGSGAAADTTLAAKKRGLEDWQAFTLGTVAGLAEVLTEKVSLDKLFDADLLADGSLKYILGNAFAEGSEEVASSTVNLLADIIVSKDESEWMQSINAYIAEGLTQEQAFARAMADQALSMGVDFLGGFISGGTMGGGVAMIGKIDTQKIGNKLGDLQMSDEDIQTFIETGLESDPETASYKIAVELQERVEKGQKLSNHDLGRLYQANVQAIQAEEEAAEGLPGGDQTGAVAGEVTDPGWLSLPDLENDTQAPDFVTQNTQNGTQTQVNDTVLPAGVPLSIADQLRQEQAQNGGMQYERTYERAAGPATAQPAGELYLPGGAGISDGSAQRNAGAGTAEQTGVLAGSARSGSAGRTAFASRAAIDRQSRAKNLRLEKVSSLDLGLQNGTEARNIQVMPQEHWDAEMSQLADRIYNETGKGVTYVMGRIQIRHSDGTVGYARGVITGDRIIIQADNLRVPMEQIADHEAYHAKVDATSRALNEEIRRHIIETFSEEQYRAVLETYVKQLRCVYNLTEARTVEEYEETMNIIEEEIFADAYAGINAFSAGADQFTGAVNERMDQLYMGKIRNQDNGTEEPTGPPADRFSYEDQQRHSLPTQDDEAASDYEGRSLINDPELYTYSFMTAQSPMKPVELPPVTDIRDAQGKIDTAKVVRNGIKNTLSVGSERDGRTYVKNRYTGRDLLVTTAAIRHGLNGAANRMLTNARLGSVIGEIVQNAIPINALHNTADGVAGTYAMAGYAFDQLGREFIAIITVEQRTDAIEGITVYDMTHAISGRQKRSSRQEPTASMRGSQADTKSQGINLIKTASEISIADLLEAVKEVYQSILSDDVLSHMGDTRNPEGHYTGRVRYSYAGEDNYIRGAGDLHRNTAGEIEARDAASRRQLTAEQRRNTAPARADDHTVFVEDVDDLSLQLGDRFSVDDDATAMERELDRLKSPAYQDELARTGGSAALARNRKRIESIEWRIRRDPETYERKKERELQTEGNTAAKVKTPSQRELEREREAWLKEEHSRKAQQKESRPLIAKRNLKETVLDLFSVPSGQRAELGAMIDSYADRLIKNGTLTEDDRKAFFDRMYDAGVMVMPAEEYSAFARSHIVDGRIYVSDSVKSDFGDDWADIRRRAFAAGVYLVNDRSASGIDQWNATLSAEDMLPGLFDSEETDQRTILERILQVAEEGKDEHLSLAEYTRRLSQQEGISEDEFLDNMERQLDWALRTFAEKARLEVTLRDSAKWQVAREKSRGDERVYRYAYQDAQRRARERQARKESAKRQKDRKELRELQQKTLKQLQWLSKNRNRAPEELQATWDEVLGDIDLYAISAADEMRWSDKHNATWKDLAQMYKDAMKNDPNFLPSKELERIVTRLDATKIADMDLGALQDLYKAAIGLRTEFYNRNNVINDEMQRLFAEVYTDAKREIESAPGGFTGGVADKFLNLDQLTPMNVLQRMAGWDPDGAFYSMAKQLERGERDMRAYSVKAQKMLQDFLTEHEDWVKKADGQGKDAIWYEVEVPQLLELGMGDKPIFGPTVKVYMTPAQKVHMYLESKNLDNLRHMTGGRTFVNKDLYGQGKRQEALSQGRTIKLAPETVRKLVSDLTPEEIELAQILDRYYNTFATQEINKVSNILYGYDKAMGKNYAPIYTNRNYTKTEFGVFDTTAEGVGNLKGRQYAVNPSYNISAFDAFERHVDQTARFCGMAIPARNWTTLMNWREKNNSTGDVITHKWGEESKNYIENLITTLQAGDDAKSESVSTLASRLQSNYISAVFGANPSIVLKQLGSIPLAGAYLDARNMPTPAQISKIDRSLISKYTQELEWRTMGYATPETKQLKDNPTTAMDILDKVAGKATDKLKVSQKTKQRVNKTLEAAFNGGAITAMDGWAASTLWPWAENKVRREHPELTVGTKAQIDAGESAFYKKVAEEFENAISRSQSVSDEMHQGTLRKSKNIVTKTFTMFRSDSAQTYNALRQKIGEAQFYARTGAKGKEQAASKKAVGAVVCALLMNTVWSEAVSFLMAMLKNKGKYYRDDEDKLTAESVIGEIGRNMMESIMGTVTFGDEIAQLIGNAITGDRRYDLEAPGLEQINEIFNMVQDLLQGNLGRISEAADVVKNGGDLGEYLSDNSGEILGEIKDTATKVATYFGLSVNNVEGYLLGALKWISPELGAAYDDLFQNVGKSDLAGMEGDALEGRVGRILSDRNVSESDDTAAALAALYEAGYKTAIPSDTPTSVSIDGEKHSLGEYQQQAYDTIWGGIVADALDDMVASDSFKEADPKTQAKMLGNLYDYAAERAKSELFDEYEMDTGASKNAAIVAAGATVAECITWNTITSEMKSGEKSAELASWDIPEEAKREIFRCKISDSREDSIAAFDEAGLSFDQFLQAYSMYGQINNEDLKAGMKAVEFSHWVNAQGYTAEQAAVVKDELTYFNMTPASSSRYDELVGAGMDPDEAYDLTGALNELQPADGEDEVSDVQKWRASVDFSDNPAIQMAALAGVMTPGQYTKFEIASEMDVAPDAYVHLYEIRGEFDADGNDSYTNAEIRAAIDSMTDYDLTSEQKAVLWQLMTGSTSARNNPYSTKVGQQVIDARKAAKED